ncbi:MAG: hypothetical protein WCG73_03510 [Candidatus Moraniibacteriota bacterium]
MRLFLFTLFVVVTILLPGRIVFAATVPGGVVVSPAFQDITLDEQNTKTDFFVSIKNTGETSTTLRITVYDFGSLDESGGVAFLGATNDLEKKYALASWIRPEKDVFMLEPGEEKKILVTIENREGLSPGGHYGALMFRAENGSGDAVGKENAISVNQLFSTLLFVRKTGGEIYDLKLNKQEYDNNLVAFQDILRLRFQNNGNIHVTPRGLVSVSDPFGRIVAKGIINEESSIILPETFRVYPVHFKTLLQSFIPGRYTIETSYRFDRKDDFSVSTLQFYYVPLPSTLGGVALIILVGFRVKRYRKKGSKQPKV